jgi:hypothetical protein
MHGHQPIIIDTIGKLHEDGAALFGFCADCACGDFPFR